ncbi:MAG: IS66 family insertion sequence element accessory protein TnpB [Comamonadaceae bacterium]|nr:IS66 family insertion sequence element accessory protein TnpB [Comamonadaceae bacterium]
MVVRTGRWGDEVIRIDALWACTAPVDMRAGADRLLACGADCGAAQAHHGYLFANARATRVKLIVHDGWGVWCAARRLNAGHFVAAGLESRAPRWP